MVGVGSTLAAAEDGQPDNLWLIDIDQPGWAHVFGSMRWPQHSRCVLLSIRHLSLTDAVGLVPAGMPVVAVWTKPLTPQRLRQGLLRLQDGHALPEPAPQVVTQTLTGYQVLVVDDVLLNQEVVGAYLADAGAAVRYAGNGEEALHLLASYRPDVILMDCHMPVMDGFTATARIRAHPDWAAIPVVALWRVAARKHWPPVWMITSANRSTPTNCLRYWPGWGWQARRRRRQAGATRRLYRKTVTTRRQAGAAWPLVGWP